MYSVTRVFAMENAQIRSSGRFLKLGCDLLSSPQSSEDVQAVDLLNLFGCVAAVQQCLCDERIARYVVELLGQRADAVEVGAQSDVIDPGRLHNVIDMIDDGVNRAPRQGVL